MRESDDDEDRKNLGDGGSLDVVVGVGLFGGPNECRAV
jgi:hypothetical protein